jgi:hypothetical protein
MFSTIEVRAEELIGEALVIDLLHAGVSASCRRGLLAS